MTNTTVSTKLQLNATTSAKPATPKQLSWLKAMATQYNLTIDYSILTTIGSASRQIGVIQCNINNGSLAKIVKPVVKSHIQYCVIVFDETVAIRTFQGTFTEATKNSANVYGDKVALVTSNIGVAKFEATKIRTAKETVVATDIVSTVAQDLLLLELPELIKFAQSMGVKLGNSKKASTIIARILAVA